MANAGVQYTVTVNKTGDGATQAIADFNAVAAAAKTTNAALAVNTTAITTAAAATKTASSTFRAMQGTLTLLGMTAFPQLTLAATTAQAAFTGIRTAAAAAGVGMLAVAGPLAVIAVGAYKAYEAMKALYELMGARAALSSSASALAESNVTTGESFRKLIMDRVAEGKLNLSETEADELDRLIGQNQFGQARRMVQERLPVGDFMSDEEKAAEVRRRIGGLKGGFAFDDAVRNTSERNAGQISTEADRSREIERVQSRSLQFAEEYNKLKAQGIITAEQERTLMRETDIERMNAIGQIKNAVTELQDLQRKSAEMFAAGFSKAFVDVIAGTKKAGEAFKEFTAQFLEQMAQILMQAAIMRILFGATGQSSGTGGLIGGWINKAATGGIFPQMMAAGGMAGVGSVSSPTYFPKFNVVAGEAGREMLTVLARPRMMEVGGMQAVVGSAQGRQLAITSASDLARGGAGGSVDIRVTLGPDLRAEIVNESVQGARVTVAQDMRTDSPISRGVKGLTA